MHWGIRVKTWGLHRKSEKLIQSFEHFGLGLISTRAKKSLGYLLSKEVLKCSLGWNSNNWSKKRSSLELVSNQQVQEGWGGCEVIWLVPCPPLTPWHQLVLGHNGMCSFSIVLKLTLPFNMDTTITKVGELQFPTSSQKCERVVLTHNLQIFYFEWLCRFDM